MKIFLKKNIVKVKKVQLNKKNFNSKIQLQKKTNNNINKKLFINNKNTINYTNSKINNLVSKYNKIITSLNNKINNSEFINNENDLLELYYNELNEFWNSVMKVN